VNGYGKPHLSRVIMPNIYVKSFNDYRFSGMTGVGGLGAPPGGLGHRCGSMMHNQSRIMMTN
jgi:hypothetical protein